MRLCNHKICKFRTLKITKLADLAKDLERYFTELQRLNDYLRFDYIEKAEKGSIKKQKKRKLAEIALSFGKKEMFGSLIFGKSEVLNKPLIKHHQEIEMHHIPSNYLSVS